MTAATRTAFPLIFSCTGWPFDKRALDAARRVASRHLRVAPETATTLSA